MTPRSALRVAFVLGTGVVASVSLWARAALPPRLPTERLISNLQAYVAEHPDEIRAHYVLGRVFSFGFALNTENLRLLSGEASEPLKEPRGLKEQQREKNYRTTTIVDGHRVEEPPAKPRDPAVLLSYAEQALFHLTTAVSGDPNNAQYQLAYAYALETTAHVADHFDTPRLLHCGGAISESLATEVDKRLIASDFEWLLTNADSLAPYLDQHRADADPAMQSIARDLLRVVWTRRAVEHYARALDLSAEPEANVDQQSGLPNDWLGRLVSYESATTIVRIAEADATIRVDPRLIDRARAHVERLELLSSTVSHFVSPIVFPLDGSETLADLLTSGRVDFDLNGDGMRENISWVKPSAAFLVWLGEGEESGEIAGGRELFGSVTWWMFFENGYRALDALDDDRNGWLSGGELNGIGVWRDANSNGVSEPEEVRSAACQGIAAIGVVEDGVEGISPTCSNGLVLESGKAVPTFDWTYMETGAHASP